MKKNICDGIVYVGVDDAELDLFENQYEVPAGMCYNSYVILDDKVAIMDSVDAHKTAQWLGNVEEALGGRTPDYLVVHHVEPDHSGSVAAALSQYPDIQIVCSAIALQYLKQFFDETDIAARTTTVKDGGVLELGKRTLTFVSASMVHWPDVLMSYCEAEKILFCADAFGKFGTYNADADNWNDEARRYYVNICGKYGVQVQNLFKKVGSLEINTLCPLHGPVLKGDAIANAINLYDKWSKYEPESDGVLIAYASIYGGTKAAAEKMAEILTQKGASEVELIDLCRTEKSYAVSAAFKMKRMILAAASYDAGLYPPMQDFLNKLIIKTYRRRIVGLIENGTWAPTAAKVMKQALENMAEITLVEPTVTIKSKMKTADEPNFVALADAILA